MVHEVGNESFGQKGGWLQDRNECRTYHLILLDMSPFQLEAAFKRYSIKIAWHCICGYNVTSRPCMQKVKLSTLCKIRDFADGWIPNEADEIFQE